MPKYAWAPAIQIDPQVPATIHVDLCGPGDPTCATPVQSWEGVGAAGSWAGSPAYVLATPGVYRYRLVGTWTDPGGQTFTSTMPGLIDDLGEFYVYTKDRPAGATGLTVDLPGTSSMSATTPTVITGHSTNRAAGDPIHYALIMPGAVLAQGELPVQADGTFTLTVSPDALHRTAPVYDVASVTDGRRLLPGRVLHITFMSEEDAGGTRFWAFHRVVVRGSTIVSARRDHGAAAGGGHPPCIPR